MLQITNKEVAECVGLWLAEGDNKSVRELTFTNNCLDLILFFKEVISALYKGKNQPRLYIYSPSERQLFTKLDGFKTIKFYIDKRANRPYYIYRLADSEFLKKWKSIVNRIINKEEHFGEILRGIFAGEGNVNHNLDHHSRTLRISSKYQNQIIENLLNFFDIHFRFEKGNRMYNIGTKYFDKLKHIRITELHPEKEAKFKKMINSVKEKHYLPNELKGLILKELDHFRQTKDLSKLLCRSELRISEVLQVLKIEGKADYIIKNRGCYWIRKKRKRLYNFNETKRLLFLTRYFESYTSLGGYIDKNRKSISKRFKDYEQRGLIEKFNRWWKLTEKGNRLLLGIDESGSEVKQILPRKGLSSVP